MKEIEFYHQVRLENKKKFNKIVFKEFKKKNFQDKKKNDLFKNNLKILKEISKDFKDFNIIHPLRVGFYGMIFFKKNLDIMNLCIFHNIFEIQNINKKKYKTIISRKILNNVEKLTIDRTKKFEKKYLIKYYKNLTQSSKQVQIVKCLDKFDNLYNLSRNPDKNIKKKYLAEIKKYIVPLIKDNKVFYEYLNLMIKINYGYIKNE